MSETSEDKVLADNAELPIYQGISIADVVWVDSEALSQAAVTDLMASDAVGFDTESKPTFKKGEVSTGPHLVQLATDDKAYLFPVSFSASHGVLKTILESPAVVKVGMGLGNDKSALKAKLNIDLVNVLDLGELLRGAWHKGTVGAKVAVAHLFGEKFLKSKRTGTSNWSSNYLTDRQKLYAANDAQVALRIYRARQMAEPLPEAAPD